MIRLCYYATPEARMSTLLIGTRLSHLLSLAPAVQLGALCMATPPKRGLSGFLQLWKDADPDIPILKQAKAEYAKLQ